MLCKLCQKIRPPHQSQRTSTRYSVKVQEHSCLVRHHANFSDLIQSAINCCELCSLFRPFIENALVEAAKERDDDHEVGEYPGYFQDDPFEDMNTHLPTIRLTKDIIYEDEGDRYQWLDCRLDEKNDAHRKAYEEALEREEEEDRLRGLLPKNRNKTDNYEILQWLAQDKSKYTGPEQIWIRGWTYYDDEFKQGGQYEASTVFTLGAGALDIENLDLDHLEWCIDNKHFGSGRTALVMEMPGLWIHKIIGLTIYREEPLNDIEPHFEFFQRRANLKKLSPPVHALDVAEYPKTDACLSLVRNWLSSCVGSHARCKQLSGTEVPTRLIDVGPTNSSQDVHLQAMAPRDQKIPYVTLSHCWGSDVFQITRLTKSNLEEMMETIDETTISKSFQDAITITRGLHIRYLWIDALCIIQDSAEDWAIESAKMAQYYKGGSVMISALASPGAGHGILHPRPSDTNAVNVSLHNHDLYIRPALEDAWSVIQDETHFHSRVRQEISIQPLNTRAWTLQERLFAPRIIHYAAQQLIWQCKTCIASEDNQFSFLPGGQVLSPVIDLVNLDTERSTNVGKNIRPTIQSTGWYNLLQGYTKRQITYPSDLLPGISGLAREVQYLTGIKYLAGIWEGSPSILLHSLLWRVGSSSRSPPPTRSHNDSPTWSWSSLRGEITQLEKGPRNFISQPFLDPVFFLREATPLTANPYGQVSGGGIQVSGFVHAYTGPSTFAEFQTRKLVERLGIGDKEEGLHAYDESALIYDNSSSRDPYTDLAAITAIGEAQQEPQIQLDIPDVGYDFSTRGEGEGGEQHILLFMGRWSDNPKSDDDLSAEQQFLLLRRVRMTDGSRKSAGKWPVFERVGIAEVQSPYLLDISAAEGWERRTGILV